MMRASARSAGPTSKRTVHGPGGTPLSLNVPLLSVFDSMRPSGVTIQSGAPAMGFGSKLDASLPWRASFPVTTPPAGGRSGSGSSFFSP